MLPMRAKHLQKKALTEKEGYGRVPDGIVLHEKLLGSPIYIRGQGQE